MNISCIQRGEFERRSDIYHYLVWKRAMKLMKIRGRKTEALDLLKSYGITTVPCFLWSNMYDDSSNLTSGADRLHQRNLGFAKRLQKAMIVDGSIFGGLVKRTQLNAYMSAIRLQGMPAWTNQKLSSVRHRCDASERETSCNGVYTIYFISCWRPR